MIGEVSAVSLNPLVKSSGFPEGFMLLSGIGKRSLAKAPQDGLLVTKYMDYLMTMCRPRKFARSQRKKSMTTMKEEIVRNSEAVVVGSR